MKSVILHIGRHTTGTTALQRFLSSSAANGTLRAAGVCYSAAGRFAQEERGRIGHHELAALLVNGDLTGARNILGAIRIEAEASGARSILLSSEGFQNVEPKVLRRFFADTHLTVVCYLREYVSYLASAYAQEIQTSALTADLQFFHEYARHVSQLWHFTNEWSANADRMIWRLYDSEALVDGNVVRDFVAAVPQLEALRGVPLDGNDPDVSISGNLLSFKLLTNALGLHDWRHPHTLGELASRHARFRGPFQIASERAASFRSSSSYNDALAHHLGHQPLLRDFSIGSALMDANWREDYALIVEAYAAAGIDKVCEHPIFATMLDINKSQRRSKPIAHFDELRSLAEYLSLRETSQERLNSRRKTEMAFVRQDQPSFAVDGFCFFCGRRTEFVSTFLYSVENTADGKSIPNWREHMGCSHCGQCNRVRAALHLFYEELNPSGDAAIYLTEQATRLYQLMRERHPDLVGSEFLGDRCEFGTASDGLRNEDLTQLTFADSSFDFVVSLDVMEHVADDLSAMSEVFRCLKPGGRFLFTAPFACDRQNKVIRATVESDGSVRHILEPEYHGNPVNSEGALCFRYFAWDALDDLRSVGFQNCRAINYWSRDFGYFGDHQFVFVADKP